MKDYRNFSPIDLALDEDFIRWVQEKKPADQEFWDEWLGLNPGHRPLVEEARNLVATLDIRHKSISPENIQLEIEKILQSVAATDPVRALPQTRTPGRFPQELKRVAAVAAIVAVILVVRSFSTTKTPAVVPRQFAYSTMTAAKHLVEKINRSDRTDTIVFADGSQIRLSPNSRISYSTGFDTAQLRDVYLSGEAHFVVAKNPRHPFRVIAGEVVTKVLGTSFCVRSFEKDTTIQVIVSSGKVSVYSQVQPGARDITDIHPPSPEPHTPGGVILTCNQLLVYERSAQTFKKSLLEHPAIVAATMTDDNMVYEDTPIEQVFAQLSKAYGIWIMYDNELMKKCTVTADLKGETFYHKLDLICRAIGASYEVIDGQVVIQSAGCQ